MWPKSEAWIPSNLGNSDLEIVAGARLWQSWRGGRCSLNSRHGIAMDSVKVDATKPAWRSMRPKFEAWIPWLGFRGSGCGKAGVEVDAA